MINARNLYLPSLWKNLNIDYENNVTFVSYYCLLISSGIDHGNWNCKFPACYPRMAYPGEQDIIYQVSI